MNEPHHPDSPWVQLKPVFNEAGGTDLGAKPMTCSAPPAHSRGLPNIKENWTLWLQALTHDSSSLDKAPGNLASRRELGGGTLTIPASPFWTFHGLGPT